jgi:hypothetical protein
MKAEARSQPVAVVLRAHGCGPSGGLEPEPLVHWRWWAARVPPPHCVTQWLGCPRALA